MKQLIGVIALSVVTPLTGADQANESIVFGGIAYFASKPNADPASEILKDDLGPDLVNYLSSINQAIRENPMRSEARAQLCRNPESAEATDEFQAVTEAFWEQAYEESQRTLSPEQYKHLVDTIHKYQSSFSYLPGIDKASLQAICQRFPHNREGNL